MTTKNTVLLLYPVAGYQASGQALIQALRDQGVPVAELVIADNYAKTLDWLERAVIPVVLG